MFLLFGQSQRERALRKELATGYGKWVDVDVAYIISDAEKGAFRGLHNDEEREQSIEQFWLRRDPTPDTLENEFKEEHYRRIAYANEHFVSGIPGWKTDRGRIYITFGPPDEIEAHPSGGQYQRTQEEGGGATSTFAFERWRYRYLEGIGNDVLVEFVDPSGSGEYRMTIDPTEKDALLHVPGAGRGAVANDGGGRRQFDRIELQSKLFRAPALKFPDLEVVTSSLNFNTLPIQVEVNSFPLTEATVLH